MGLHGSSTGAVFHRCALQVNPHEYSGIFRGQAAAGDARSHAEAVIEKAGEHDISILAITDHNDASNVVYFKDAAVGTGITVFPGFEIASSEGIHVLCIYPPNTDEDQLGRFLGDFGIHRVGSSSDLSNESFVGVLARIRDQGGISVAAHATYDKGLLNTLTGQARINAWKSQDLLAIQIPSSIQALPMNFRQMITSQDPQYLRSNPASDSQAVAVVNAKDVVNPEDLDDPSATCLIKMSEVSIEGLRQRFSILIPVYDLIAMRNRNATQSC